MKRLNIKDVTGTGVLVAAQLGATHNVQAGISQHLAFLSPHRYLYWE
jgi:hypothetical protein